MKGKIEILEGFDDPLCLAAGLGLLPVGAQHAEVAGALDLHHRGPFDRILVAQAQIEQVAMMTVDPVFDDYDVATL